MVEPLYTEDGERFIPSEHTRGPWDPAAQHAGPPAALIGRAFEAMASDVPMHITRLTLEMLRPIPLTPLRVRAFVERAGRRVQLVGATQHAGEAEVARARAVRIRAADVAMPPLAEPSASVAGPETLPPLEFPGDAPAFHQTGVEQRYARGSFFEPGPAAVWMRLRRPVVEGETPSPLQRVLAAADFGNGVSALLDWRTHIFINPDLTVHVVRPAAGEWIGLEAESTVQRSGIGLAHSVLRDVDGLLGYAVQSLLVDTVER